MEKRYWKNCATYRGCRSVKRLHNSNSTALLAHLQTLWPEELKKDLYAAILCKEIRVNGEIQSNPKTMVSSTAHIRREAAKFVGRGGEKLDAVLDKFPFDPAGRICLDAGASTGGFTDCLLQRGAAMVHAVDSGYNQLAWKLKSDPRVALHERTNIMQIGSGNLVPKPEIAVADLAFRSLRKAASRILDLLHHDLLLALVKPQFEGPKEIDFDGVVRTDTARAEILYRLKTDLETEGVHIRDAAASPIPGRKGNAEIFLLLSGKPSPDTGFVDTRLALALKDAARIFRQ